MENRVRGDNRKNSRWRIHGKAVPLAQMKQPGDGINIATRDEHAGYRRGPESFTRMQYTRCLDLQS